MPIFIVDDDVFYTSMMEKQLENCQALNIETFQNLDDALVEMENQNPRILFLDLHLADGDTTNRIEKIKTKYPNLYVIVTTATDDKEVKEKCLDSGAFYYLQKNNEMPNQIKKIIEEINKYRNFFS